MLEKLLSGGQDFIHKDYKNLQTKISFWKASYRCDSDLLQEKDAHSRPILTQFSCEPSQDYEYRKKVTKPRAHVGNILSKMNGYIFRNPPSRSLSTPAFLDFVRTASLKGDPLDKVIKKALLDAQIEGCSYLVADNTNTTAEQKTLAQARAEGDRPFVRVVSRESVLNWVENDGYLTEAIVLYQNTDGQFFIRHYTDLTIQDFLLDDSLKIVSSGALLSHGYASIPIVRLKPDFATNSQCESLAELQQELTFWLSLLAVEGTKSVYTLHTFTGTPPPPEQDGKRLNVSMGTNSIIYLGEEGSLGRIGAETSASTALMEIISKVEQALYRQAGMASGDPFATNQPQSGLSKLFDQKDLASVLITLADAAEHAENQIIKLLFNPSENQVSFYDKSFDLATYTDQLSEVEQTIEMKLPNVLKRQTIDELMNKHFSLTEEEQSEYEAQLLMLYPNEQEEPVTPDITTQTLPEEGVTITEE